MLHVRHLFVWHDCQLSVGFHDTVSHLFQRKVLHGAHCLQQVVDVHVKFGKRFRVNALRVDHHDGFTADEALYGIAFGKQEDCLVYHKHGKYRHHAKRNWDGSIRHRYTGEFRYYQRNHQLERFHFTDLSFAHQSKDKQQHGKQYQCPNEDYQHTYIVCLLLRLIRGGQNLCVIQLLFVCKQCIMIEAKSDCMRKVPRFWDKNVDEGTHPSCGVQYCPLHWLPLSAHLPCSVTASRGTPRLT